MTMIIWWWWLLLFDEISKPASPDQVFQVFCVLATVDDFPATEKELLVVDLMCFHWFCVLLASHLAMKWLDFHLTRMIVILSLLLLVGVKGIVAWLCYWSSSPITIIFIMITEICAKGEVIWVIIMRVKVEDYHHWHFHHHLQNYCYHCKRHNIFYQPLSFRVVVTDSW